MKLLTGNHFSMFGDSELDLDPLTPNLIPNFLSFYATYMQRCIIIYQSHMKLSNRKEQFGRFFKSKKGIIFCIIQSRVMILALHGPLMVLSKCA